MKLLCHNTAATGDAPPSDTHHSKEAWKNLLVSLCTVLCPRLVDKRRKLLYRCISCCLRQRVFSPNYYQEKEALRLECEASSKNISL
jgi:hypothetical protein